MKENSLSGEDVKTPPQPAPVDPMVRLGLELEAMKKIYEVIKDLPVDRAYRALKAAAILHDIRL